jgi:cell wall assembly regulator SMI1
MARLKLNLNYIKNIKNRYMQRIIYSGTEEKTTIEQIEQVENLVGLKFPPEYKQHLLLYNGGHPEPCVFDFFEKGAITQSDVAWFLAVYDGEYSNLADFINIYKIDENRLPKFFVPIASDSVGNLICISCGPDDYGCIYFWDHELEETVLNDNHQNVIKVSDSLISFLDGLKPLDSLLD